MVEARVRGLEDSLYTATERLDALQAQLTQQLANANLSEASHQQVHREVQALREELGQMGRHGARERQVDKNLLPDFYSLEKAK